VSRRSSLTSACSASNRARVDPGTATSAVRACRVSWPLPPTTCEAVGLAGVLKDGCAAPIDDGVSTDANCGGPGSGADPHDRCCAISPRNRSMVCSLRSWRAAMAASAASCDVCHTGCGRRGWSSRVTAAAREREKKLAQNKASHDPCRGAMRGKTFTRAAHAWPRAP